jgi:hypothetical protein
LHGLGVSGNRHCSVTRYVRYWVSLLALPERRLVEAAEFAGVESGALFAQQIHGGDADSEVLGDAADD